MEASGGRTGREGDALRWWDERELERDCGRSWSSLVAESAEEEERWGDELRTLELAEGALKDSSKGLGSR
jgi:hypothetical protein